jgi:broad specificity phosphatase PhoE
MVEYLGNLKPIILVRHAQSYSNVDPSVGGWQDPGLTPHGEVQAKTVAKRLKKLLKGKKVVIYSSHLKRAYETTEYICQELESAPILEQDLQEYQSRLDPSISRTEAAEIRINRTNPYRNWRMYSGAESLGELYYRAGEVLSKIMDSTNDLVLIISHGWLIDKMVAWWVGISEDNIKPNMFTTANASLSVLSETEHGEKILVKLNDTAHLDQISDECLRVR